MTQAGVRQTTAEVRVHLHEYLRWFTARIVSAADSILAAEKEPAIQAAALRFKANGVTSMQGAIFQHDPLAAATDAWALTVAISHFVEDGNGSALFGRSQPVMVDAFHGLTSDVEALAQRIGGTDRVNNVRPQIERFVREYPVTDLSFGRRSAGLRASVVTAAAWGTDVRQAVAQLDETARDLSDRLTIYAEQLPEVARWQGEILLIEAQQDLMRRPFASIDRIDANFGALDAKVGAVDVKFGALVTDVGAVTGVVTGVPTLLSAERTLLLDALARERATILSSIDAQRVATLVALTAEREAILAAGEDLRRNSFRDIGIETARSLERVDKLSAATVLDLNRASKDAIDYLFWRALQLLLVAVVACALVAVVLRHTASRPGS